MAKNKDKLHRVLEICAEVAWRAEIVLMIRWIADGDDPSEHQASIDGAEYALRESLDKWNELAKEAASKKK